MKNDIVFGNQERDAWDQRKPVTAGASPEPVDEGALCRDCGTAGVYLLGRCHPCADPVLERTRARFEKHGRGRIGMTMRRANGPGQAGLDVKGGE